MAVYDPSAPGTGSLSSTSPFVPLCTPGKGVFVIWSMVYAPPIGDVPAQIFLGEWTGTTRGSDIGVYEIQTGTWRSIPFSHEITSTLFVDPYRPVIYLSSPTELQEINRVTLEVKTVAKLSRRYTADFDQQGRIWLSLARDLHCYDPATGQLTEYKNVIPDEFHYAEGTHAQIGVGPDGRVWLTQSPIHGLSVFDPVTGLTKVVSRPEPGSKNHGYGIPVVVGDLVWTGRHAFHSRTDEPISVPFPLDGPDRFVPVMRGSWRRSPSAHLQHGNNALVRHHNQIGWIDVTTGQFDVLGIIPPEADDRDYTHGMEWSLHGTHTLFGNTVSRIVTVDLTRSIVEKIDLGFTPEHAQRIYHWHVGPYDHVYASGMSHDLWHVYPDGKSVNEGDLIRAYGGELHAMSTWKEKLFIISYTGSVVTRLDMSRPRDNWGKTAAHNPHHILDMSKQSQHRPRGSDITPDGRLYFITCSDYCDRREGSMVIINALTEEVEAILDPLVPGEQLWALAVSHTRPEVYIGTSEGSFIVWGHAQRKIKHIHKFTPRPGDGQPTSAMIKVGGVRFMATCGDIVVGNIFGGEFETWMYHADTGIMDTPKLSEHGKLFGVWPWRKRNSIVARYMGSMYEIDASGKTTLLYADPLPGFVVNEDSTGRLLMSDDITVFVEKEPKIGRIGTSA